MLNGLLIVNKPAGISSAALVGKVKRAVSSFAGEKIKVGHTGTLDPMATGVMVLALGKSTRLFDILMNKKKGYRATFAFGYETDTLDCTGKETARDNVYPLLKDIRTAIENNTGHIMQLPPAYSAKSLGGVKAYKLARMGEKVVLNAVAVDIYSVNIVSVNKEPAEKACSDTHCREITVDIDCGGGTYVRSLGRDIAAYANAFATMTSLIRTYSGDFSIEQAHSLDEIEQNVQECLIPVKEVVCKLFPVYEIPDDFIAKVTNGVPVYTNLKDGRYVLTINGKVYAIGRSNDGCMKAEVNLWM